MKRCRRCGGDLDEVHELLNIRNSMNQTEGELLIKAWLEENGVSADVSATPSLNPNEAEKVWVSVLPIDSSLVNKDVLDKLAGLLGLVRGWDIRASVDGTWFEFGPVLPSLVMGIRDGSFEKVFN